MLLGVAPVQPPDGPGLCRRIERADAEPAVHAGGEIERVVIDVSESPERPPEGALARELLPSVEPTSRSFRRARARHPSCRAAIANPARSDVASAIANGKRRPPGVPASRGVMELRQFRHELASSVFSSRRDRRSSFLRPGRRARWAAGSAVQMNRVPPLISGSTHAAAL